MAFEYLAYNFLQENSFSDYITIPRRVLRDLDNPFDLESGQFQSLYRLRPDLVKSLIFQLDGELRGSRITAIATEKQVFKIIIDKIIKNIGFHRY